MRRAVFFVPGVPAPQGSKTGFAVTNRKTGKTRAVVVDKNPAALRPWRDAVRARALAALEGEPFSGAVSVEVTFQFVRPVSVRRVWPSVRPDLDKLLRALLDGVTESGLYGDDGQVVDVRARKVYAAESGAVVRVREMEGTNE